ncbi:MAG: type IX secretion system membrane protein PorP/SprF, partial [Bacteroidales bacterium]|nr:type IX secretion system membrane protein PorP/SprF [Bacteroidales bacterium]
TIGGYYRVGDALVLLTQLDWDQFSLGLSYDVNLSDLTKATNSFGAFEVTVKFVPIKPTTSNKLL